MTTMDNQLLTRLRDYDSWHQRLDLEERAVEIPSAPWHLTVMKLLPDLNGQRVLEIGCGRGDFSLWLAQTFPGADVVGIDFSSTAIAIANLKSERASLRSRFIVADAETLGVGAEQFDYVISCECLEHVPSPQRMVAEIKRVLKPGGKFILTTENYFNGMILAWLISWIRGTSYDSGLGVQPCENFFLFWRVKKLLQSAGLKIDHMESNHFQWLLLPRTDPMRLVRFDFKSQTLKRLFRPFGRHYTFCGHCA